MERDHGETLSAFFDGEPVDAEQLADSLAQPGAAALLAEFAAMRAHEQRDRSRPSPEFYDRMSTLLAPSRVDRLLGNRFAVTALAASLLIAAGAGGFALGSASALRPAVPASRGASSGATAGDRAPASPSTIAPPAVAGGPSSARSGPDRAGPPLSTRRVQLEQWQDTSALTAVEAGR
jgi:hypothetical protein